MQIWPVLKESYVSFRLCNDINCSNECQACNTNIEKKKETICDQLEVAKHSVLRSYKLLFGLIIILINNVTYNVLQRHENWTTYQNRDPKRSHKQRKIFQMPSTHNILHKPWLNITASFSLSFFSSFCTSFITW